MTRSPIVAGTFYEAEPAACRRAVEGLIAQADALAAAEAPAGAVGGLVPHAGWVCSGAVAALTLKTLLRGRTGSTIVLLGAVHAVAGPTAMVYDSGAWRTPLGEAAVDADLAGAIRDRCPHVVADRHAHAREHSIEVQIPLIQALDPSAKIVPILTPPYPTAAAVGAEIGSVLAEWDASVLVVGSTDLTHYGPRYGITTAGVGAAGVKWAMANDRRVLAAVEAMDAEAIIPETTGRHNACGGGAIAASIAACRALGATAGTILCHTNSCEMLRDMYGEDMSNSVGYASVVFA